MFACPGLIFYTVCSVPWLNGNLALAEKCSGPLRFRLRQVLLYKGAYCCSLNCEPVWASICVLRVENSVEMKQQTARVRCYTELRLSWKYYEENKRGVIRWNKDPRQDGVMEKYSVIQKDGFNFVRLYFLNYTWYVNDLHNIWKRRS